MSNVVSFAYKTVKTNCITLLIGTKTKTCKVLGKFLKELPATLYLQKLHRALSSNIVRPSITRSMSLRNTWVHKHPMFGVAPADYSVVSSRQSFVKAKAKAKAKTLFSSLTESR
ncbi:hypothetical protein O9993_04230 [Vibrio lentus]|nr:hypothetical protein [Vibrio lentus]